MTEQTEKKENKFKKLLALDPLFINKFERKLKPYAKWIYYVLSFILGLMLLKSFADLFLVGISTFLIEAVLTLIYFVVVRMWAEYISNAK